MASRIPQHTYVLPLQNESERILREIEQTTKIYHEVKRRINSDCEKEIEEGVAQVRRKYETQKHELDAKYLLKKQELDANYKKVYMNKMLAEAFRTTYMDIRVSEKQEGLFAEFAERFKET